MGINSEYAKVPFIFDCHCHIGSVGTMHIHGNGSVDSLICMMDLAGIDKAAFSHMLGISGDAPTGNRLGSEAAQRFPGKIYHYVVFDPNEDLDTMLGSINEYIDDKSTIGIKLHPMWHATSPDDPRYDPILAMSDARKMPVLIHTWGREEVRSAERVAKRHPESKIMIGHSGGAEFNAIEEAARAAADNPNVWLDLTMSITYDGLPEYLLTRVPVEKILFGSDMNYIDPRTLIGRLAYAKISDVSKAGIFGGNFLKMISGSDAVRALL